MTTQQKTIYYLLDEGFKVLKIIYSSVWNLLLHFSVLLSPTWERLFPLFDMILLPTNILNNWFRETNKLH